MHVRVCVYVCARVSWLFWVEVYFFWLHWLFFLFSISLIFALVYFFLSSATLGFICSSFFSSLSWKLQSLTGLRGKDPKEKVMHSANFYFLINLLILNDLSTRGEAPKQRVATKILGSQSDILAIPQAGWWKLEISIYQLERALVCISDFQLWLWKHNTIGIWLSRKLNNMKKRLQMSSSKTVLKWSVLP